MYLFLLYNRILAYISTPKVNYYRTIYFKDLQLILKKVGCAVIICLDVNFWRILSAYADAVAFSTKIRMGRASSR